MPLCRKMLIIMMTLQVPGAIVLAAGPLDGGGPASADVRSALGAIFDDDHVAQEALQTHERAMRLEEIARFDFLARWVLPSEVRRGDVIYQIFQSEPDSPPQVLGAMKIGTDPVPSGLLRALIHTGGDHRKTVIRFKSFRIYAEEIVDG